jgi:hypothetical protein
MRGSRRKLLVAITAAAAGALTTRTGFSLQMSPQPMPSPNAPRNQNVPGGLDNAGVAQGNRQSGTLNPVSWGAVQKDAEKLLQMAGEFKDQVNQTNLSSTLPLNLLKEAHQIEKLAKQIQDRMKSS